MNRHVYLNNDKSNHPKFNRQRNVSNGKSNAKSEDNDEQNEPKIIQEYQKENLRSLNADFFYKRKYRTERRSIELPAYIDLIKIKFYNTFNLDLRNKFFEKYGLFPIEYKDFNKTVIFEIVDMNSFNNFINHVQLIISSKEGTSYYKQDYNLLALVYQFKFVDSESRIQTYSNEGVLLNLIKSISLNSELQKERLFQYLKENNFKYSYDNESPDMLSIDLINREDLKFVADNFDVVKAIISSRIQKIRPGYNGPIRDYDFEIKLVNSITTVGVIDTGVQRILPLRSIILSEHIDHTNTGAFWDEVGHGTMVAGLVALGEDFYKEIKNEYEAKSKIFVIKALHNDNDPLNIPKLISDIRQVKKTYGIRIFNMSLVIPGAKKYNETYSQFAYELDKLSYEEDVLIFISVGNFNAESLKALIEDEPHPDHDYPDFFYKREMTTLVHSCEDTNICIPSESLNNISVGALAGNLEEFDNSHITPNQIYPAYYTRKFHYDYSQSVNGQVIKQKNKHLNKPDFIFEGGDLFNEKAGLEILRSPFAMEDKFYGRSCGTSLATPLVTSYASEILNAYPNLKTQTVKAILINSAKYFNKSKLPHFREKPDSLLKSLVGFGRPLKSELIFNNNNSISFIIEDDIKIGEIIKIPINLPKKLKDSGNKLQFDISLCYSFMPIKDNQLDYNPLHISFSLTKDIDVVKFEDGIQDDYGIKKTISWSEDHFGIDNRLFSNSQFMTYRLQPTDFVKINDKLALSVRCLAKNQYLSELSKINHSFSIVCKISELISNDGVSDLYSEMLEVNDFLEIDNNLDLDIDLEN